MRRYIVLLAGPALLLARCVGDDSVSGDGGSDASADTFVAPDAPSDAGSDAIADSAPPPACDLAKPFGAPVALPTPINGAGDRYGIWLSQDQLTAWFNSDGTSDGGTQTLGTLYVTSRTSITAGFASPVALGINSVGTGYGVGNVTITADGLVMYFGNGPLGAYRVWTATRQTTAVDFTNPTELGTPVNEAGTGTYPGWISPDGGTLYFVSDRAGGSGAWRNVWTAERGDAGGFTNPAPLANVNIAGGINGIVLTPDELQAFAEQGNTSIYYTSRASTAVSFAVPQPITELNTFAGQHGNAMYPSYVSADGCTVYFGSSVPEVIYSATRGK